LERELKLNVGVTAINRYAIFKYFEGVNSMKNVFKFLAIVLVVVIGFSFIACDGDTTNDNGGTGGGGGNSAEKVACTFIYCSYGRCSYSYQKVLTGFNIKTYSCNYGSIDCETCNGTGNSGRCTTCNGTGKVKCIYCSGTGKCQSCNGTGYVNKPTTNGGGSTSGTLTISGYPYAASSTYSVHALNVNPTDVKQYLNLQYNASGSGLMEVGGTVTWIGTKTPPNGTYTIVVYRMSGKEQYFYKATGVSITNGSGSVSWSRFSQFK
jgi:hypothetical protein